MELNKRITKVIAVQRKKKEREILRELNANGFKRVQPYPDLFVNECGTIYSLKKEKVLTRDSRNNVSVYGKRISVAKLVLCAFKSETIQANSHITHKNGNRNDFNLKNIQYAQIYKTGLKTSVNAEKLKTAIRCYFEIPKRFNVRNYILARMYLNEIIERRNFYANCDDESYLSVFKSYMQGCTNSRASVAKAHGISVRDCNVIVNKFTNKLTEDVLNDLEAGRLQVKAYQSRPKTKTQVLREVNEYLTANGGKPVPLRRKSKREILKEYKNKCDKLFNNNKPIK